VWDVHLLWIVWTLWTDCLVPWCVYSAVHCRSVSTQRYALLHIYCTVFVLFSLLTWPGLQLSGVCCWIWWIVVGVWECGDLFVAMIIMYCTSDSAGFSRWHCVQYKFTYLLTISSLFKFSTPICGLKSTPCPVTVCGDCLRMCWTGWTDNRLLFVSNKF